MKRSKKLSVGFITDLHWNGCKEPTWNRYYADSMRKLEVAIRTFQEYRVDFVVNLGDTVDGLAANDPEAERLRDQFRRTRLRWVHVLGNHDADLAGDPGDRKMLTRFFEMPAPYYGFDAAGFHFIVLDGNYAENGLDWSPSWDRTWLGEPQQAWLRRHLAEHQGKATVILIHQLVYPPAAEVDQDRGLCLRDAARLRQILEETGDVLAIFSGHHHEGGYRLVNRIHHIVLKGMVEGKGGFSYAIAHFSEDGRIFVQGFGREVTRDLPSFRHE